MSKFTFLYDNGTIDDNFVFSGLELNWQKIKFKSNKHYTIRVPNLNNGILFLNCDLADLVDEIVTAFERGTNDFPPPENIMFIEPHNEKRFSGVFFENKIFITDNFKVLNIIKI